MAGPAGPRPAQPISRVRPGWEFVAPAPLSVAAGGGLSAADEAMLQRIAAQEAANATALATVASEEAGEVLTLGTLNAALLTMQAQLADLAVRVPRIDATLAALVYGGGNAAALPLVDYAQWTVTMPAGVPIGDLVSFTSSDETVCRITPASVACDANRQATATIVRIGIGEAIVSASSPDAGNILSRIVRVAA